MTRKVMQALQEYEGLVATGKIKSFTVQIKARSVLITPDGAGAKPKEITMIAELVDTVHACFYGMASVTFGTYNYFVFSHFFQDMRQSA